MCRSQFGRFFACALALALCAAPAGAAQVKLAALDWPHDTQLQFGIYNGKNERTATAYYRILKEKVNNRTLYHFKYLGRNEKMSESSEVWVDPVTQLPVRSTRKVAGKSRTLYVDCAYEPGMITVRQKYEGQRVSELKVPAGDGFFDFEQLVWLIPQIEWPTDNMTYLNYFNTFKFQLQTAVVTRDGSEQVEIKGKTYPAVRYRFDVGSTRYVYWAVDQNGRAVPARIFMDDADDRADIVFANLGLESKKVKAGATAGLPAAPPLPAQGTYTPIPVPEVPLPPAVPPPPPPTAGPPQGTPPEEVNPLVPPEPGGRFP